MLKRLTISLSIMCALCASFICATPAFAQNYTAGSATEFMTDVAAVNSLSNPGETNTITLTADVDLGTDIAEFTDGVTTIIGAGHSLTGSAANGAVVRVLNLAKVSFCKADGSDSLTIILSGNTSGVYLRGGTANFYYGLVITGSNVSCTAPVVLAKDSTSGTSATLNMYGGSIKDVTTTTSSRIYAGGVLIDGNGGTFNFSGGEITNCVNNSSDIYSAGGIYMGVGGVLNMSGNAAIKNCKTTYSRGYGGGVLCNDAQISATGGSITGCSSQYLGGGIIFVSWNGSYGLDCKFENFTLTANSSMVGGGIFIDQQWSGGKNLVYDFGSDTNTIIDNTASGFGDDAYIGSSTAVISLPTNVTWYEDPGEDGLRYSAGGRIEFPVTNPFSIPTNTEFALKAAHIYTVKYEFESSDGTALPQEVLDLLPADSSTYGAGDVATAIQPAEAVVKLKEGTWKFDGYDNNSVTVGSENVTFTGKWSWAKNEAPEITASDVELTVGDTFDALKSVTAKDAEDGDLTASVKVVSNNVDTSKAGTYKVEYSVTDSNGVTTTKTITVTVKAKADPAKPTPSDPNDGNGTGSNNSNGSQDEPLAPTNIAATGDDTLGIITLTFSALLVSALSLLRYLQHFRKR